jgi:predicted dinucleotide-binding enzyme
LKLEPLAAEIGQAASVGTPAEAAEFGEVVVFAVPWDGFDDAVSSAGSVDGKILIDTTNQYGSSEMPAEGETAASFHAARVEGARYTKSFNTLTSAFQAEAADRPKAERVVQWVCGDDEEAKRVVMGLISDAGYAPVDIGWNADAAVMEAPRRPGAVYGEEYRLPDAEKVVEAVRAGEEIPPTPNYS